MRTRILRFIYILPILIVLFVSCDGITNSRDVNTNSSIVVYLKTSLIDSLSQKTRIHAIDSAFFIATRIQNDSVLNEVYKTAIKFSYRTKMWERFLKHAHSHLKHASKVSDSFGIAKTREYLGRYYMDRRQQDSAFYYYNRSFEGYVGIKDSIRAGRVLVNKAIIEKNISSYPNSVETSLKALRFLRSSNDTRLKSSIYNNLGNIYNQLSDKENALKFHQKAYQLRKEIQDKPYLQVHSLNNIGKVYQKEANYVEAIRYYDTAFGFSKVLKSRPRLKAMIMDNRAFSRFMNGEREGVLDDMIVSLEQRTADDNSDGVIISSLHLAKYYTSIDQKEIALEYSKKAERLSTKIDNHRDYLESLKLLGNLEDGSISKNHFNKYIEIKDSLDRSDQVYQRTISNMLTEMENLERSKVISEEVSSKKSVILSFTLIGAVLILIFGIWAFKQKQAREKDLLRNIEKVQELKKELETFSKKRNGSFLQKNFDEHLKIEYGVTRRQLDYWHLLVEGLTKIEMAKHFKIDERAVSQRGKRLYEKLQAKTDENRVGYRMAISIYLSEIIEFKNAEIAKIKTENS